MIQREGGVWVAGAEHVAGAHAWGTSLAQTRRRFRRAAALMASPDADAGPVLLPDPLAAVVEEARDARTVAERACRISEQATRHAVITLARERLSDRDIAELLGISHQRVQQIRAG